ncbi:MAG: hypothetical protein KDC93_12900 [Cyclobacteriaceae bacterium]|nr:hypothetical protein [Cyclobacteriaceae bacterium]
MLLLEMTLFFGRFHPIVVHFPIALLLLAVVIEIISRVPRFRQLSASLPFLLLGGFISSLLAVALGWLIANDRGYDDDTLLMHRWLGVSVSVVSLCLWLVSINLVRINEVARLALFALVFILVSLTGHQGGNLTHGDTYLIEHAPEKIRTLLMDSTETNSLVLKPNPDSVNVFQDIINPILIEKCTPCHTETQKKGGLDLTSWEGITNGGDNGPAIKPNKPLDSELFIRITLPQEHVKFMPIKSSPLTYGEIQLIKWWIEEGAPHDTKLTALSINENIEYFFNKDYNFNPNPKPIYEVSEIAPASPQYLMDLKSKGYIIQHLAQNNNYLAVAVSGNSPKLTLDMLEQLLPIKDNITWIDFRGQNLTDQHLGLLGSFDNLTRLNIQNNPITDKGIQLLAQLRYLESLNAIQTQITNESLAHLVKMESLKRMYLWQTLVAKDAIDAILKERPDLTIESSVEFQ